MDAAQPKIAGKKRARDTDDFYSNYVPLKPRSSFAVPTDVVQRLLINAGDTSTTLAQTVYKTTYEDKWLFKGNIPQCGHRQCLSCADGTTHRDSYCLIFVNPFEGEHYKVTYICNHVKCRKKFPEHVLAYISFHENEWRITTAEQALHRAKAEVAKVLHAATGQNIVVASAVEDTNDFYLPHDHDHPEANTYEMVKARFEHQKDPSGGRHFMIRHPKEAYATECENEIRVYKKNIFKQLRREWSYWGPNKKNIFTEYRFVPRWIKDDGKMTYDSMRADEAGTPEGVYNLFNATTKNIPMIRRPSAKSRNRVYGNFPWVGP